MRNNGVLGTQGVEGLHLSYVSSYFVPSFLSIETSEAYITPFSVMRHFPSSPPPHSQGAFYGVSLNLLLLFRAKGHNMPQGALPGL